MALFFSHDMGNPDHHPNGWIGFIVWLVCMVFYGVCRGIELWILPMFPSVKEFDEMVIMTLHILSGISLLIGISAGALTLRRKVKELLAEKKKGQK